ncbi:MAG: M48 family metallopeptidase [Paludibacteraceae bacterium]|nr:M48 family metallopeptidase [Paludibacteraceae bacterium]
MPNIYNHIEKNKRETAIIMVLFILIISAIAYVFGNLFDPGYGGTYVGVALIFSGISSFISYYNSDKLVLAISGAKKVEYDEDPDLHNLVDNMCIASGLPKPKIYKINDTAMNAFATGRDPEHAAMCFTTGIVNRLEKRELEGVIAHELSHIQNYDIRLMSIVSILVGTITLLADWFTRGVFYGGGRGKRRSSSSSGSGIFLIIGILLVVLSPVIATLIKLAISRNREFLADSSAALMTRYPQGLANALKKLAMDTEILEAANGATAHLYISSPLKGRAFVNLFNTHPPIEERIARLESM